METFFCAYGLGYKIIYIHGILKDLLPFILFSYLHYRYKSRLRVNEKKYIIMYEYEYVNWQTNHCGVFFFCSVIRFFMWKLSLKEVVWVDDDGLRIKFENNIQTKIYILYYIHMLI